MLMCVCLCLCFYSCESPSCRRCDVTSCRRGGTCNTWFVLSVKRNKRKQQEKKNLIPNDFCQRSPCLPCPVLSSRSTSRCVGSAAAAAATADHHQPAGHHHGKPSIPPSLLSVCFPFSFIARFILPSQAQQMTMQAMAMSSTPASSPPTSPITSPPTSPLLPHLVSPYAVLPPSPYANMPPSPYANFSPNPYATAGLPPSPSPYAPSDEPTSPAIAAPRGPKVSAAAQVSDSRCGRVKTTVTYYIIALTF